MTETEERYEELIFALTLHPAIRQQISTNRIGVEAVVDTIAPLVETWIRAAYEAGVRKAIEQAEQHLASGAGDPAFLLGALGQLVDPPCGTQETGE